VSRRLGAEDGGLLLGLADEQDTFGFAEAGQVFCRDIVFALPLGEGEDWDGVRGGEVGDGLDEGVADGSEQRRGGKAMSAVVPEKADHAQFALQLGDVDVEVHAVDAFDLQGHVRAEDIGDGLR
jgi:hypothetical protein